MPNDKIEVLITVKAYPNPSSSLAEAVCVAGVRKNGGFVRLYPIPFRDLEDEQQFSKYQWIRLQVREPADDKRPESFRPNLETLEIISKPLSSKNNWSERRAALVPKYVSRSLCDIMDDQRRDKTSLGFFMPKEVLDFDWKKQNSEWTESEKRKLEKRDQLNLFRTKRSKLLEKIPFVFRYRFRCFDCRNKEPHHIMIIDWELAQLYRKLRQQCETVEDCLQKTRDKWLDDICGENKETYFFTGNMHLHPTLFLILGVFYPPLDSQLTLL